MSSLAVDLTDANMLFRKCRAGSLLSSAVQIKAWFQVQTASGIVVGGYGDYLMQDPSGKRYVLDKKTFDESFVWEELDGSLRK